MFAIIMDVKMESRIIFALNNAKKNIKQQLHVNYVVIIKI